MFQSRTSWVTATCVAAALPFGVAVFAATPATQANGAPAAYLLEKEPKGAQPVRAVREKGKHGQDVVVVGRIGGRTTPWIKGMAAFSLVDSSLKSCDQIPGDKCPTPWDYCCTPNLAKNTVLVTFVDGNGQMVKKDARDLLKVKELQTVVLQGKVYRDKANNVRILASRIYIRGDETVVK